MEECRDVINTGLRDVIVASTKICEVDGAGGRLVYRGYMIQDLARNGTFEEVIFLLLNERLPRTDELERFKVQLGEERRIPAEVIAALKTRPRDAHPMDILQCGVSLLAHHDPDLRKSSREAAEKKAMRLVAKFPTLVAAWERIRNGRTPVAPDPAMGHGENFLFMLHGKRPDPEIAQAMDVALILHAEHAFNASTFAAREVASTGAHMYAAVAAAVGSLSGPLHGGANARVMEMLLKIGSVDKVDAFVENVLESGGKIMGLGHAVYKTDDPRALILAPMSRRMGERSGETRWYEISKRLEEKGKEAFKRIKGGDIYANVDFYSASLYYAMGLPIDLFTPVFAISRVAGWTAHVLEEKFAEAAPKPVLYRPESKYVGEYCGPDVCEFVPMDER